VNKTRAVPCHTYFSADRMTMNCWVKDENKYKNIMYKNVSKKAKNFTIHKQRKILVTAILF